MKSGKATSSVVVRRCTLRGGLSVGPSAVNSLLNLLIWVHPDNLSMKGEGRQQGVPAWYQEEEGVFFTSLESILLACKQWPPHVTVWKDHTGEVNHFPLPNTMLH